MLLIKINDIFYKKVIYHLEKIISTYKKFLKKTETKTRKYIISNEIKNIMFTKFYNSDKKPINFALLWHIVN